MALKALQVIRTTSPLVQHSQEALNDISTCHAVGLYWVSGHAGVRGYKITNGLTSGGSAVKFVGPEPALRVSRHDIRRIRLSLVNQHWVWWSQRQDPELISGPCLGAKAFNRTKSRVVTGLLSGCNTLRRHLHQWGCQTVHCVGGAERRMKPQHTFCVNV